MTGWRRLLRLATLLALVVVIYFAVPVTGDLDRGALYRLAIILACVLLLSTGVIWQVRLQLEDEHRRLDGLLVALVVAVLAFALGFYVMELHDPGQVDGLDTRLDSLYFTMSTLLTIGYGDVHAVGQGARGLVLLQMVFNVVVITTAVTTISERLRHRAKGALEARRAAGAQELPPPGDTHVPRRGTPADHDGQ